jgi:hypothetical protein
MKYSVLLTLIANNSSEFSLNSDWKRSLSSPLLLLFEKARKSKQHRRQQKSANEFCGRLKTSLKGPVLSTTGFALFSPVCCVFFSARFFQNPFFQLLLASDLCDRITESERKLK